MSFYVILVSTGTLKSKLNTKFTANILIGFYLELTVTTGCL